MKAMILAAGKGTRVQPLTYDLPKPMIPMLGKPVMEYLIEELSRHGFTEIMVNVSHLPEKIEGYFGDGRGWGVEIGYSFEGHLDNGKLIAEPLGSAGGLKRIQDFSGFFDDTFLVVCGDALIELDLTNAIRKHWQSGAVASVVVQEVPKNNVLNYGVVVCDNDGKISSFQEKPTVAEAKSNLVNTGIYIFEPEVLAFIPPEEEYDIGSQLFPNLLQQGVPFNAIQVPISWVDIGRLSDFWSANQQLMLGKVPDIHMPGEQLRPGIWGGLNVNIDWDHVRFEGPVYIGASSRVEAGCEVIGPTWVGHGCHLQSGTRVSRSIVFEHSRIGPEAQVIDAVVSGRYCVDKDGNPMAQEPGALDWVGDARDLNSLGRSLSSAVAEK